MNLAALGVSIGIQAVLNGQFGFGEIVSKLIALPFSIAVNFIGNRLFVSRRKDDMNARVLSCGLSGISGRLITVEVDLAGGIPSHETVGLPGKAVSESRERVRAAIKNCGFPFRPPGWW